MFERICEKRSFVLRLTVIRSMTLVHLENIKIVFSSVAEPKLFIFGSGSDFDHNVGSGFGSSSNYSHILALKTVLKH